MADESKVVQDHCSHSRLLENIYAFLKEKGVDMRSNDRAHVIS